jgi:hypothetical protein
MAIDITASNARSLSDDVWALKMAPHEIRHFGQAPSASGIRSVLLLTSCEFNPKTNELRFPLGAAVPLNIGTTDSVIAMLSGDSQVHARSDDVLAAGSAGPGDRAFLSLVRSELSQAMVSAAEKLLAGVRARSPGDLKRGKSRNFSETPDNFWYVIVQPRINEISVTVRGSVSHFDGVSKLEIKDDRGNTRFKVRGETDVDEALKLISHAIRRP